MPVCFQLRLNSPIVSWRAGAQSVTVTKRVGQAVCVGIARHDRSSVSERDRVKPRLSVLLDKSFFPLQEVYIGLTVLRWRIEFVTFPFKVCAIAVPIFKLFHVAICECDISFSLGLG